MTMSFARTTRYMAPHSWISAPERGIASSTSYGRCMWPDVDASVIKVDAEKRIVAINLITNGGVAGSTKAPEALTTSAALPEGLPARNRAQ